MQNWELHSICFYLKEYKWKKLRYTAASIFTAAAFQLNIPCLQYEFNKSKFIPQLHIAGEAVITIRASPNHKRFQMGNINVSSHY